VDPTYFVRERGLTLAGAASTFGLILVARLHRSWPVAAQRALARRIPARTSAVGWSLVASLPSRCRRAGAVARVFCRDS